MEDFSDSAAFTNYNQDKLGRLLSSMPGNFVYK